VALPDDLVAELDPIVDRRGRSACIAKAAREKLRRDRLGRVRDETEGVLADRDIPALTPTPDVAGLTSSPMPDGSSCPVTLPPDPSFVPPPCAEAADGGEVWDGSPSP
jgi:hypothetical protein